MVSWRRVACLTEVTAVKVTGGSIGAVHRSSPHNPLQGTLCPPIVRNLGHVRTYHPRWRTGGGGLAAAVKMRNDILIICGSGGSAPPHSFLPSFLQSATLQADFPAPCHGHRAHSPTGGNCKISAVKDALDPGLAKRQPLYLSWMI